MEEKEFIINFYDSDNDPNYEDYYDRRMQRIWSDFDEKAYFSQEVYDLVDCPEDATISRDLINCSDIIDAIKFGFFLAKYGYTSIKVINKEKDRYDS